MVIEPKIRGFICTTAHPAGCAANVQQQIDYVLQQKTITNGPKKVLVIGASTGYGLASRISAAFGCQAATIGVSFEKPATGKRTASAGWYNTAAFETAAHKAGLYAKSINGDAFSNEIKQETLRLIKEDWGGNVDLVIYSIASPRRVDPNTGDVYQSTLKTIGKPYTNRTLNIMTGELTDITIDPATGDDIKQTELVMGGDDWSMWMNALHQSGLLTPNATTLAYSYIGPQLTFPIYRDGTIGAAKKHLEKTASQITKSLNDISGKAYISVNKGLVTQASSAIPMVPLYISILYNVTKDKGLHEGCIEQMWRMLEDKVYPNDHVDVDNNGLIRMDDWEMREDVQTEITSIWNKINPDNLEEYADIKGYRHEFLKLFGFEVNGVDYSADVNPDVPIPSIGSAVSPA